MSGIGAEANGHLPALTSLVGLAAPDRHHQTFFQKRQIADFQVNQFGAAERPGSTANLFNSNILLVYAGFLLPCSPGSSYPERVSVIAIRCAVRYKLSQLQGGSPCLTKPKPS